MEDGDFDEGIPPRTRRTSGDVNRRRCWQLSVCELRVRLVVKGSKVVPDDALRHNGPFELNDLKGALL